MERWRAGAVVAMLALVACTTTSQTGLATPAGPRPWPTAQLAPPDAPPRILGVQLSETAIAPGDWWSGRIATSTNVASVEVRTESFSFVAERTSFGQFRFSQHVLDMVPQYKRGYTLAIVARNTAGQQDVYRVPIRFR